MPYATQSRLSDAAKSFSDAANGLF